MDTMGNTAVLPDTPEWHENIVLDCLSRKTILNRVLHFEYVLYARPKDNMNTYPIQLRRFAHDYV